MAKKKNRKKHSPKKEHTDFKKLMRFLFRAQIRKWQDNRNIPPQAFETRQNLSIYGNFINETIFNGSYWDDDHVLTNFRKKKQLMFLPPLEKDAQFVPVMTIDQYHPNTNFHKSCLKLRILLIKQDQERLVGIGFRIESPERYCRENIKSSMHDFYHAQLIDKAGIDYGPRLESIPYWLPSTQPSFPLWAINPIDAIFNLILTLYGMDFYRSFLLESKIDINQISASDEFLGFHKSYGKTRK